MGGISKLTSGSGIPPHKPGNEIADYTIPAIRLPDGSYIMESTAIAEAIEAMYPEPEVHLDAPVLQDVMVTLWSCVEPLIPMLVPRMPRECLSGTSISFHIEARKVTFGMSLDELEARHGGGAWEKALPGLSRLATILKQDPTGPFCLGKTPSYADFVIVGFLEWAKCLGGGIFEDLLQLDLVYERLYASCKLWLQKNN